MTKTCPRCQQPFACQPDAIHACGCTQLTLTADELSRLRTYTAQQLGGYVCLCNTCLMELSGTLPGKQVSKTD